MSKKLKITLTVLTAVMIAAVAAAAIIIAVTYSKLSRENEALKAAGDADAAHIAQLTSESADKDKTIESLESEKVDLEAENEALTNGNGELSADVDGKAEEIARLQAEILKLNEALLDTDSYYGDEIKRLRGEIAEKQAKIDQLREDMGTYGDVFDVDFEAVALICDQIDEYIENNAPYAKKIFEDGSYQWFHIDTLIEEEWEYVLAEGIELYTEEELAESGIPAEELSYLKLRDRVYAREDIGKLELGIYYEDVLTGYSYGYNEAQRFGYASVIKAPYVLAVLEAVSADEKAYLDGLAENELIPEYTDTDGDGENDTAVIEYSDPKYDLSDTVIYEPATMYRDGSGIIKTSPEGTEYSYLDLASYTVMYSDNVAYSLLKKRFDYGIMYTLANRVGVSINNSSLSAEAAGKLFLEIESFIATDERYGPIMFEALKNSNHKALIPLSIYGKTVINKYGWDDNNYNDCAIVYSGTRPYVITVFTNLNFYNDSVNGYLRKIVSMIDGLHTEFTSGK